MSGDYSALAAELQSPDLAGLDDEAAAAKLNADAVSLPVPGRFLAEGGVLDLLGPTAGATAIGTIEFLAESDTMPDGSANTYKPLMAIVVRLLRKDGIDFGGTTTQGMLDMLAAGGVLDPDAAAALKAHGTRTTSRAGAIEGWGVPVSEADVAHARSL